MTEPPVGGITKAVINAHRDFALISLFGLGFTGAAYLAVGGAVRGGAGMIRLVTAARAAAPSANAVTIAVSTRTGR